MYKELKPFKKWVRLIFFGDTKISWGYAIYITHLDRFYCFRYDTAEDVIRCKDKRVVKASIFPTIGIAKETAHRWFGSCYGKDKRIEIITLMRIESCQEVENHTDSSCS